MKKTQRKDAYRNILKRIASYLSLCLVIVCGMSGLLITDALSGGMDYRGDEYYRAQSFKDFDLMSSAGISESNLERIRQVDGVTEVEGVLQASATAAFGDKKSSVTILSQTKKLSVPKMIEGKLPAGQDECLVGEDFAENEGLKVGDKIRITLTDLSSFRDENPLFAEEFTITGLMSHPDYLRRKGTNTVVLPLTAVNTEVTRGYYSDAFVGLKQPEDISVLSDEYLERVSGTRKELERLTKVLEKERLKEVQDEAHAELEEEQEKAEEQFTVAREKLEKAQTQLNEKIEEYTLKISRGEILIAKVKQMIKENEPLVKKAQEILNKIKEEFDIGTDWIPQAVSTAKKILELIDKEDPQHDPEYLRMEQDLAGKMIDHEDTLRMVVSYAGNDMVAKMVNAKVKEMLGIDVTAYIKGVAAIPIDRLMATAYDVKNSGGHFSKDDLNSIVTSLRSVEDLKGLIDKIRAKIEEVKRELANAKKTIRIKKQEIVNGKVELFQQKRIAQNKIDDGQKRYDDNRAEYEKKIAEAREEIERLDCSWVVIDRKGNAGYEDIRSNIRAVKAAGSAFGVLFMLVTALVCFSTLAIIIDEQKKLVGTTKAFGFHKKEVMGKYLTFGISASVVGSILGLFIAAGITKILNFFLEKAKMYPLKTAPTIISAKLCVIGALIMVAVTSLASIIACSGILRSPASVLMKGAMLRSKSYKKQNEKRSSGSKGTLYSRLILRNMRDDKARVAITIVVIGMSSMLMGAGISMNLAYKQMLNKQIEDINKYDLRVDVQENISDEDRAAVVQVLEKNKTDYLPATRKMYLYRSNGRMDGLQLISADAKRLGDFVAITNRETGKALKIPDDGVLIQNRMNESYQINKGDTLTILDGTLKARKMTVKGYFLNYIGRLVVVSPEGYQKIFKGPSTDNCYFVKLKGAKASALKQELLSVYKDASFEAPDVFKTKYEAVQSMYDIIVYLMTLIAVVMSFMILTNMANIFLNRKKTELTVMRVNGFSVKQTRGYLVKEAVITTAAGLALGVLFGYWATPRIIMKMQQPDLEFVKSFHPMAWIISVALEGAFAAIIYTLIFRKVKDLDLKDIS